MSAGEAAVLVGVIIDEERTVRANLTFDAGLLSASDAPANERGLTRSAFLASAAREKIAARGCERQAKRRCGRRHLEG